MKEIWHKKYYEEGYINPKLGRKASEETKQKQRESMLQHYINHEAHFKGRHHTEETKRKLSEAHKGEKNYCYGKKRSKEIREKMSESAKIGWEKRRNKVLNKN